MIVWATEFPVPKSTTAEAILDLLKKWLRGSPHLPFRNSQFPDLTDGDTVSFQHEGHTVRLTRIGSESEWWLACQLSWTEKHKREWTTELVAWGSGTSVMVGVRLECNLVSVGLPLPRPKKPYIMKLLLTTLGGGADSWLKVDDEPTYLSESQVDEAASVIEGTTTLMLPVVYVSATATHRPYINPAELAEWLAGMAHVMVEPSRHFSFALARNTNRNNPYGGAIAVLWPRAAQRQSRLVPRDFDSADDMTVECADRVRIALASMRATPKLTWHYTQELVARQRIETLRKQGSTELNAYVSAFDEEVKAKDQRLQDAEREIGRLHSEIRRLEAAAGGGGGLLRQGDEQDSFPGEIQEAVVYALGLSVGSLEQDGRRLHIVQDILKSNPGSGNAETIADQIKKCFASHGDLDASSRRLLEDLGFEIKEDGRHYKAVYQGDGRYTFTISKSSSDHRAGKNLASLINRTLFK